jgi:hypothetical protein
MRLTTTAELLRRDVVPDEDERDDEEEDEGLRGAGCSGLEQIRQFWRKRPWRQNVGKPT